MMHNSLLIQKLLKTVNNDPLRRTIRNPFKEIGLHPRVEPAPGDFKLNDVCILVTTSDLAETTELIQDLTDFLQLLGVRIIKTADYKIRVRRSLKVKDGSFHLKISVTETTLAAADIQGMWAGSVYLQKEISRRRGPFLPKTLEVKKDPAWSLQFGQAPFGSNYLVPDLGPEYLSDDAFRLLAHYGLNGMTIYGDWLCYVRSELFPELNHPDYERNIRVLKEATERAARFGIKFYYCPIGPKLPNNHPLFLRHPQARGSGFTSPSGERIHFLCSSDDQSLKFHAETFQNLFRQVPELGGLLMIIAEESFYHCYMNISPENRCPVCGRHDAHKVVSGLVGTVSRAVHETSPDAKIMVWAYHLASWFHDYQRFISENLPEDVWQHSCLDKDQRWQKNGYQKLAWDYSIDFTGPSDRSVREEKSARKRRLGFSVKLETALGLELFHLPYVPCLPRIAEKWEHVFQLKPDGVHQSWMFFGMWGSRSEEIGWWKRWFPELTASEVVDLIAKRDFGPAAGQVIKAWKKISAAMEHTPFIHPYFWGPSFLGPAHPLFPEKVEKLPDVFQGYLYYRQEGAATFSKSTLTSPVSLVIEKLPSLEKWKHENEPDAFVDFCGYLPDNPNDDWKAANQEWRTAAGLGREAFEVMSGADALKLDETDRRNFTAEKILVEFVYRTLETVAHTWIFLKLRQEWEQENRTETLYQMKTIARKEMENAFAASHLYKNAPWLNLAMRTDGKFPDSLDMIDEKVAIIRNFLNKNTGKK